MFYFREFVRGNLSFDAFNESTASLSVEEEVVEVRSFLLRHSFDNLMSNCSADDCGARRDLSKDVVEIWVRNDISGWKIVAEFQELLDVFFACCWRWIAVLILAEHLQNLHDKETWTRLLLALDVRFWVDIEAIDCLKRRIFQRTLRCRCNRLSLHLFIRLGDQLECDDISERLF